MVRSFVLTLMLAGCLFAQMPKGIYAWWNRPEIAKDLNLASAAATNPRQRAAVPGSSTERAERSEPG